MALRETSRRWLMRLAAALLLVAGSLYVGLCLGRPLYYTDGAREIAGHTLAGSGMLEWRAPEAIAEVPGPVAGRMARLPDGRWCYGRLQADGTADLVLWDPARPQVPPEPLAALNTEHNELAPALLADGSLWFASDRPGGAGGYDLYAAPSLRAGTSAVRPVAACNTALDETDPTLPASGEQVVFVRIDRSLDRGNDGTLWHWQTGQELDPQPVFPLGRPGRRPIRRDPAFAPDGGALWFVEQPLDGRLRLLRASRRGEAFAPPLPIGGEWGRDALRAPWPSADGRELALLSPRVAEDGRQLLYSSTAHEVYPWWPGQRWLEWLLLGVIATSLLLLLLLHFGRRWSALDLLAQCLLLSLLLHALLFLWLMGVEIPRSDLPGDDDGGMQVSVQLAAATASATGAGSDVGAIVAFSPRERDLAAAAPAAAALPAAALPEGVAAPAAEWTAEASPNPHTAQPELADAAATAALRAAPDAPAAAPAAAPELAAVANASAAAIAAARATAAASKLTVVAPGSGVARPVAKATTLAGVPQREIADAASEARASTPRPEVNLHDPVAAAVAEPVAVTETPSAAPQAAATGPAAPAATAAATVARPERVTGGSVAPAEPNVAAPSSALARSAGSAALVIATPVLPASQGRPMPTPMPIMLRDADAPVPMRAAAAPGPAAATPKPLAAQPSVVAPASAAPPAVVRNDRATAGAPQPPKVAAPGSALVRAAAARSATQGSVTGPAPTAARQPVRPPVAIADAPERGAASAAPVARTGAAAAPTPIAAAIGLPQQLRHDAPERPQRGGWNGALAAAPNPVRAPATRLPRPAAAPLPLVAVAPPAPAANAYSNRFGPAKVKALEQFGGTAATERAVQSGLRYLASKQHRDGAFGDREDYDDKYGFVYVGKTGLCLLAFLGAGHSPSSQTEFSDHVRRGLAHLLALQDENGAFGPSSCYGHGIATYALAECYGLTKAPELVRPLERALTWILDHQGPRRDARNRGGWGYFSPGLQAEDSYARVSVSAWMIMALESARLSGVELPEDVLPRAREFLELAYDKPNGWFRYNHKPSRLNSAWPTLPASTPAAGFCLQLLGVDSGAPMVQAAVDYTVERRPQRYRRYQDDDFVLRGQGNVYFWYYGTLCCFLRGGDAWQQWNERLSTVLPRAQAADGSFPPIDVYAEEAGDTDTDRTYTTAMCVLCLEVYYRYFTPLLLGR
ncbi:MAG: hypothetical protein MUC36_22125 [Planctomycetes bacterium]|jgi:hypothetical protein|nr:hypothetical protein [Planctomycetota bacterium]